MFSDLNSKLPNGVFKSKNLSNQYLYESCDYTLLVKFRFQTNKSISGNPTRRYK